MTTEAAPLTTAILGAAGDDDQGIVSGVNNTAGQLAGLLMIVVLPTAAGLAGTAFDDAAIARGFETAMRICVALAVAAAAIAAFTIRSPNAPERSEVA